jgi:hypothetical protein
MVVLGNVDMLSQQNAKTEQRDYMHTLWAWMSSRPEYGSKSANQDLTMKIDLDRHSRSAIENMTLLIMPFLAFLVAIFIWNTRRH